MAERTEDRKPGIRSAAEAVFSVATGASLIASLLVILTWSQNWVTPMWLTVLRCAAAMMGLILCDRKETGFRILVGYLVLVILRLAIPSIETLFTQGVSETLFFGAWSFLACYTLGNILGRKRTELFLKAVLAAWVICMAALSGVALYAAWTDQKIWNIGQGGFWGLNIVTGDSNARLKIFFDANTSGTLFGLGTMAAFLCIAGFRNKWIKAFHILLLLPSWTALSLTDSRTAQISVAIGIGSAAGILILRALRRKRPGQKRLARDAAAVCGALLTAAVCVALFFGTTAVFNGLKVKKEKLLPVAGAEEAAAAVTVSTEPAEIKAGLEEKISLTADVKNAEGPIGYQWQYSTDGENWQDATGASATRATLRVLVKPATYKRRYRCVLSTENDTVTSGEVTILKPYSVRISLKTRKDAGGDTATLTAQTEGAEGDAGFLWQVSEDNGKTWTDLASDGGAGNRLTVAISGDKRYRCTVTAGNGIVVSGSKRIYEPSGTLAKTRGFDTGNLLSGRTWIWRQTVAHLKNQPMTLLIGRSISEPMKDAGIMRTETIVSEHCHNMFLQTLLESGIPGLALMLAFMACTARRALRLIRAEDMPTLLTLLPAAVGAVWVGELTECIVRMSNYRVPNFALLMLYAGAVCAMGNRWNPKAGKEARKHES